EPTLDETKRRPEVLLTPTERLATTSPIGDDIMVGREFNALERKIRKTLEQLQQQLLIAEAGVAVATQLLKAQNAEQDRDIANILEHCVAQRSGGQPEGTEALLAEWTTRDDDPLTTFLEEGPPRPRMQ